MNKETNLNKTKQNKITNNQKKKSIFLELIFFPEF